MGGFVDFFSGLFGGGSEARQKAKMYEKLEKTLGEKLDIVNTYYTNAETMLNAAHDSLTNGPGEAQGKIITDFISKENVWKSEYKNILMAMQNAKTNLVMRKSEAAQLKTYWQMQADLEEQRGAY